MCITPNEFLVKDFLLSPPFSPLSLRRGVGGEAK